MILKMPSRDIMNALTRSTLAYYTYDETPDDTSIENVLRQCLILIAGFPAMAVYAYQALAHYHGSQSLFIHSPKPELSTAENILHMLRPDSRYTQLEATLLDLALVLHAEHGGGNNSSIVTHVVTSSGSDTYSTIAAALGSLKGPRHGGANIKVMQMFDDLKENVKDWKDDEAIEDYLMKVLNKQAFDKAGLIYGIGHAVYSISDPRALIFKDHVEKLARANGMDEEYELYAKVERLGPEIISRERKMYKGVSANVDFYSGFVYRMLGNPMELFTPLFAISASRAGVRIASRSWSTTGKSSVPPTRALRQRRRMCLWRTDPDASTRKHQQDLSLLRNDRIDPTCPRGEHQQSPLLAPGHVLHLC
jgi:citrate synthase